MMNYDDLPCRKCEYSNVNHCEEPCKSCVVTNGTGVLLFEPNGTEEMIYKASDKVNHPAHYQGRIECIDYIDSVGMSKGFCLGNAIKYIHRAGHKNGESVRDDLEKAAFYINWYLERCGKEMEDEKD